MIKISVIFVAALVLQSTIANAQTVVTGHSRPGRLGKPATIEKDTRPPVISLAEPAGAMELRSGVRGLQIVSNIPGDMFIRGTVEDDREVEALIINDQRIPLNGSPKRKTFSVTLPTPKAGKTQSLNLKATDKAGNATQIIYEVRGPASARNVASTTPGRYWALIIGISEYQHPSVSSLDYPVSDAGEVAAVLTQQYTFDPERVNVLRNPTRSELIGALYAYAPEGEARLTEQDNLLVFYAGHGFYDKSADQGYWLPSNAEQKNRAEWVSNNDVQRAFKATKAKHILLLSDACFSGSMFATRSPFTIAIEEAYKLPSRRAITAGVLAVVPDKSVFKEFLLKRLVENSESYLDAGTLYNSIKAPVTNNSATRQVPQYGVIHETGDEGGDFIFVKRW